MLAFGEGIDSVLSDYDQDSCIITQQATYRGLSEIRGFVTAFLTGLPNGFNEAFKVNKMEVVGEVAYITWESKPWSPLGSDTFVIRDGKIRYQTLAMYSSGE